MKRIISNGVCIIVGILFALPVFSEEAWQVTQKAWFSFEMNETVGTSSALFDLEGNLNTLGRFYQSVTNENPDGDQEIR